MPNLQSYNFSKTLTSVLCVYLNLRVADADKKCYLKQVDTSFSETTKKKKPQKNPVEQK